MKKTKKEKSTKGPSDDRAATPPPETPEPAAESGAVAAEESIDPQQRIAQLEGALLRAKADYQNFQRRAAVERSEGIRYANADVMKSMLSVLDDFERSLEAAESSDDLQALVDGIRLIYDNLSQALRAHGLESIDALHQPFDPNVHEAMLQQPSAEHPSGMVVEQIAKGYRLRDRVLRPARVIVSKGVETQNDQATETASAADQKEGVSD
jgi:molecular chaperone GrpE